MGADKKTFKVHVEATGADFEINPKELVGRVRDILLDKRKQDIATTHWKAMTSEDQKREVEQLESFAFDLVNTVVQVVAAGGMDVIHAQFDGLTLKSDGSLAVKVAGFADDKALVELNHMRGKLLKITAVDESQFDQRRERVDTPGNQQSMFEDEQSDSDAGDVLDAETGELLSGQQTSEQFDGGHKSRMNGYPKTANPFEPDTVLYDDWEAGWLHGDAQPGAPDITPETDDNSNDVDYDQETGEIIEDTKTSGDDEGDQPGDAEREDPLDIPKFLKRTKDGDGVERSPFQEGQECRKNDGGSDENPYDGGTEEYNSWREGYGHASSEISKLFADGFVAAENGMDQNASGFKDGTFANERWLMGWKRYHQQKESDA